MSTNHAVQSLQKYELAHAFREDFAICHCILQFTFCKMQKKNRIWPIFLCILRFNRFGMAFALFQLLFKMKQLKDRHMKPVLTACSLAALLSGCMALETPRNIENAAGPDYPLAAEYAPMPSEEGTDAWAANRLNAERCVLRRSNATSPVELRTPRLSIGDLLDIELSGDDVLSGAYEIGPDGTITPPFMPPLYIEGLTLEEARQALKNHLVQAELYQDAAIGLTLDVLDYAPLNISISGAVFQPGLVSVGGRAQKDRDPQRTAARGDFNGGRTLSAAVRAAAGVRPDADISRVTLSRGDKDYLLDLTPSLEGRAFIDPQLSSGDTISIPSRECFQETLVRPSALTQPGVRIYLSNLTKPADSNAQSAIGKDASNFPYGTRLLQALVSANCVGGTQLTNAQRYAVLMANDPITRKTWAIERSVEALVRRADRDVYNPYLMPGDAIACYDSAVTNGQDVLRIISDTIVPAAILNNLANN